MSRNYLGVHPRESLSCSICRLRLEKRATMFSLYPTADFQCCSAAPLEPRERTREWAGIGREGTLADRGAQESEEGDRPTVLAFLTLNLELERTVWEHGIHLLLGCLRVSWASSRASPACTQSRQKSPLGAPVRQPEPQRLNQCCHRPWNIWTPGPQHLCASLHVFTQPRWVGFYSSYDRRFVRLLL